MKSKGTDYAVQGSRSMPKHSGQSGVVEGKNKQLPKKVVIGHSPVKTPSFKTGKSG